MAFDIPSVICLVLYHTCMGTRPNITKKANTLSCALIPKLLGCCLLMCYKETIIVKYQEKRKLFLY